MVHYRIGKLIHEDPQPSDHFGWQVAISGNIVAVGAERDDIVVAVVIEGCIPTLFKLMVMEQLLEQ